MSNIFIIHSGQQTQATQWLQNHLKLDGHRVIDTRNLVAKGDYLLEPIFREIEASDLVIAIVDDRSENVLFELGYAFGQQKIVVLVSLSDVTLPSFLRDVIWLRLHKLDHGSATEVLGAIRVLADKERGKSREPMTRMHFDRLVADWLKKQGAQVSPSPTAKDRSEDFIVTDPSTSTRFVVETKDLSANNWVSIDAVRQLSTAVMETGSDAGIMVTSSYFTPSALEFARQSNVPLILWGTGDLQKRDHLPGNAYIEARPKGRPEGSAISDFVVEDRSDHVLATFRTQREAIEWARKNGHTPLVARVRHLNNKKSPDHWRRVDDSLSWTVDDISVDQRS
jgi:hypothetical protein